MTEGRVEVKGRRKGRPKQLVDGLKEKQGYWKFEKWGSCRYRFVQNSLCKRL
jgi:hypothetical protein